MVSLQKTNQSINRNVSSQRRAGGGQVREGRGEGAFPKIQGRGLSCRARECARPGEAERGREGEREGGM